ncbi:MAG: homoserine O-acetyltransferase [Bacteroidota bacterium]
MPQFFNHPHPFALESGAVLPGFTLAYECGGAFGQAGKPLVWVCHALTGNSEAPSWWPGIFDLGGVFDPEEYGWICANMLGSCYGSTHALSLNPDTGKPWFHTFPTLTNRDIVRAFDLLREFLEITQVEVLIGGSLGGQQVLEWGLLRPEIFRNLIPIATNARHSAWGIAFNESQRMAIAADPTWQESQARAGLEGLKVARSIAMLSYRSYEVYNRKQTDSRSEQIDDYRASSYQRYMGEKIAQRFNAFSYWTLSQAMDSHHLGRGRGTMEEVLGSITIPALVIGVDSDLLFPLVEQEFLARHIPLATLTTLHSDFGHDGFLVEMRQLDRGIRDFLAKEVD